MLEVYERLGDNCQEMPHAYVELTHEQRDKGRLKTRTKKGVELRIFLDRGKPLMVGEYLRSQCGKIIRVEGALEAVATARCDGWLTFSRACYHLGNRHVKIQVGNQWLRILPDHVLEEMLLSLGLTIEHETAVFVPESGAYSGGHSHGQNHSEHSHSHSGQSHSHSHSENSHAQDHDHAHPHSHSHERLGFHARTEANSGKIEVIHGISRY